MLKAVNDVSAPKASRKNLSLAFWDVSTTNSCEPFFNGTLLDLKNLKKKEKKERKRKQGLLDALISLTIRH